MRKRFLRREWMFAVLACGLVLYGCGSGGGSSSPVETTDAGITPATGRLVTEPLVVQEAVQTGGDVDILLVLDSSASLEDEREKLAQVVPLVISELSDVATHTVAFILAWGSPGTPEGYEGSGHLYRIGDYPWVLDSTLLLPEEMVAAVAQTLRATPPFDLATDQGEAGLYALNQLLTVHAGTAQSRGFLREGAALAVIFMSDENDICAIYPEGVIPDSESSGVEAAARDNFCFDPPSSGNQVITPELTYQAALALSGGAPVLFSGIIYVDEVPPVLENEIGYGYLEAIQLSGGVAADLASEDFALVARNLGNAINALTADIQRRFLLSQGPVNPLSISVSVDGELVTFTYVAETNEVVPDYAGHTGSVVEISYRVLEG